MARPKLNNQRTQTAYDTRDEKRGTASKGAINWAKVGKNPRYYKPEDGTNSFNVIPFTVTNPDYPLVRQGSMKVGEGDWMLDLWVHQKVGPDERDVACPKQNWGKKCPICERVHELYEKGDKESKDQAGSMKAKRRVWLNVQPIVKGTPQDVEVFEVSHFLFAKELLDEAGASGTVIPFADPDEGTLVQFRFKKGERGKTFDEYKSFKFPAREEELEDEAFDQALDFSKGVSCPTADELEALLYGQNPDDMGESQDAVEEEGDRVPPRRSSRQEDEPEAAPPRRSSRRDEDEDDGDRVPPRASAPEPEPEQTRRRPVEEPEPAKSGSCPSGHKWGADCDRKPECAKCKLWDDCMAAS